jgi:ribosome biogenesis protein ERB1
MKEANINKEKKKKSSTVNHSIKRKRKESFEKNTESNFSSSDEEEFSSEWNSPHSKLSSSNASSSILSNESLDLNDLSLSDEDTAEEESNEEEEIVENDGNDSESEGYEAEMESLNKIKDPNNAKNKKLSKKLQKEKEDDNQSEEEEDVYVSEDEFTVEDEENIGQNNESELDSFESDDDDVKVLETFENGLKSEEQQKKPSLFDDVNNSDDSSEDESIRNTIGNVPLEWYEEYDHIGYDRDGNKIFKKKRGDALDNLIARHDDPNYIRTVYDELNDREYVLSNKDLQTIIDIQKGKFPPGFNPYRDYVDYVKVDSRFPIVGVPDPKSRYTPNKLEQNNIAKLAQKMKKDPKIGVPQPPPRKSQCYLMWGPDGSLIGDKVPRVGLLQAPKVRLPGHSFSYNPPPEYIRNDDFTPRYDALRKVPAFSKFVEEQYKRCLDLYMAPRTLPKKRLQDPQKLLPELPRPEELRPYPEIPSIIYEGHGDVVKKLSIDPTGRWLATGSDDFCLRLYESNTGRLMYTWQFEDSISWVEWNPNAQINLLAVAVQNFVYLIQPAMTGTEKSNLATKELFPATAYTEDISLFTDKGEEQQQESSESTDGQESQAQAEEDSDDQGEQEILTVSKTGRKKLLLKWKFYREEEDKERRRQGILMRLEHLKYVTQVTWHYRGDYFCTLSPDAYNDGIVIHQLSKRQSQKPFKKRMKNKGQKIVRVLFHPKLPQFFVSTSVGVKVYNMQKQRLYKKLKGQRCRFISSMAVHPSGDHVLTGGFDKRSEWFDLELSSRPYKTLRYHVKAVRSVAFHPRYPLFATSSDDGNVHVFHCSVYDDWLKDPLIVPLKILRGHRVVNHLGVLDLQFHPTQPWLFSCGADQTARLWIS